MASALQPTGKNLRLILPLLLQRGNQLSSKLNRNATFLRLILYMSDHVSLQKSH